MADPSSQNEAKPLPTPGEISRWPEAERRDPPSWDRHYLALKPLAAQIRAAVGRSLAGRDSLRVLDIGCGNKPYLPLVAAHAGSYVGIDAVAGPEVDVVGVAEELPFPDDSFDVVLCTQVLEHVDDPARALAEIDRVLAPGGLLLLSTHGVFLYHPDPGDSDRDYWRWTHSGLLRIVREAGQWERLEIEPQGNLIACVGYLLAQFAGEVFDRLPRPLSRALMIGFNRTVEWIDRRFPPHARVPRPGSVSANYLVVAEKPA